MIQGPSARGYLSSAGTAVEEVVQSFAARPSQSLDGASKRTTRGLNRYPDLLFPPVCSELIQLFVQRRLSERPCLVDCNPGRSAYYP